MASEWKAPRPGWLIVTVTTACSVFWFRLMAEISPAGTPETLKSAPVTSPKALSKSIL